MTEHKDRILFARAIVSAGKTVCLESIFIIQFGSFKLNHVPITGIVKGAPMGDIRPYRCSRSNYLRSAI